MTPHIRKYESTSHIQGSGLQTGDRDVTISFSDMSGKHFVVEEKLDGANSGLRFDGTGELLLQSRGHYLDVASRDVWRERHFNLMKDWARAHQDALLSRFEDRFIVYGEWMAATHSIFYDALPHLFMEFDIFDLETGQFLDTRARHALCQGLPIAHVPVLFEGQIRCEKDLQRLVGPSLYQTADWQKNLRISCNRAGDDFDARLARMDQSGLSEGLYLKEERDGMTVGRSKYVRPDFTQTILAADEHWHSRLIVPNLLSRQMDVFPEFVAAPSTKVSMP